MRTPILVALSVSLAAIPFVSQAGPTPEHAQAARELIRVTLRNATELKVFHEGFRKLIAENDKLSEEQKKRVVKTIEERMGAKRIEDLYVPVYAKHYTLEQTRALLKFYATPLGKTFLETEPRLRADLHRIGLEYGQKVMADVALQIQAPEPPRKPAKTQ